MSLFIHVNASYTFMLCKPSSSSTNFNFHRNKCLFMSTRSEVSPNPNTFTQVYMRQKWVGPMACSVKKLVTLKEQYTTWCLIFNKTCCTEMYVRTQLPCPLSEAQMSDIFNFTFSIPWPGILMDRDGVHFVNPVDHEVSFTASLVLMNIIQN